MVLSIGFLIALIPWALHKNAGRLVWSIVLGLVINLIAWPLILPADNVWNWFVAFGLNGILATILHFIALSNGKDDSDLLLVVGKGALTVLAFAIPFFASLEIIHPSSYAALAQVQEKPMSNQSDINIKQIVTVPLETAQNKAMQVVGAYGAQFELGKYDLQLIKNELYWVTPLEFTGYKSWSATEGTPGFVLVSATDPLAPAKIVDGFKLKYMDSAYFGQYLQRYVHNKHPQLVLSEASFEVDDQMQPKQVVSVGHYELGRGATVIDGVVIVDPSTGEAAFFDQDKTPAWVDQIVPMHLATDYVTWWGDLSGGWWNSVWDKLNLKRPTAVSAGGKVMAGVNGSDGQFYWFTGMTSPRESDTSMIGYVLVQARTGKTFFHPTQTIASEENVVKAVNAEFQKDKYVAAYPLPYQIFGSLNWVVPVINSTADGRFMGVAIVSGDNTRKGTGSDLEEALRNFKSELAKQNGAKPSEQSKVEKIAGTVERVVQVMRKGNTVMQFTLAERPDRVFEVDLANPYAGVTQKGDAVEISFLDTNEVLTLVKEFTNLHYQQK